MELVLIVIALALSAFFSGSEIAFTVANRLRLEARARREGGIGQVVQKLVRSPSVFLTTTLVGSNVALVVYSTMMALYLGPLFTRFFSGALGLEGGGLDVAVLVALTVAASALVLVLGEILPRSVVRERAGQAIFAFALPLRISYYLMFPFIRVAGWAASLLARVFRTDAESIARFIRRDFEVIIQESKASGELELDESRSALLENAFALNTIKVRESMVPRTDIVAVDEDTTIEALRERFARSGHSRLPVYAGHIDNIVGLVFAYDLFHEPRSIRDLMRPVKFVPESKRVRELLSEFLKTGISIAVVIDEYGGTAGLVTREDLLEELIGDIQDEFDVDDEVMRQTGDGTFVVSGRVHIDELAGKFDLHLPEGDYETVAGYLLDRLGTIPGVREEFTLDGFQFYVLKATPRHVELVRIIREAPEAP